MNQLNPQTPTPAPLEQLKNIATTLRSIIEKSQKLNADAHTLEQLLEQSKTLEAQFSAHSHGRMLSLFGQQANNQQLSTQEWAMRLPYGPVTGPLNPIAPPVRIEHAVDEQGEFIEKLWGFATLGTAHEGPRNSVNGGTLASIYDHLLAFATMAFATPGPTAQLEIRYRAKTPLHEELRFETWISKIDGKKIHTAGRCYAGDLLCTEASALFIKYQ